MKAFGTAIMALTLLWGLSGCVVTPDYPTYGAYPYDYPSCAATATYYGPAYYGAPAYYGPGDCYPYYPYYGTFFLGGYYHSYDRHHHHYYSHAVRVPPPSKHRHATVGHRRHNDRQWRGDRIVTAPPHRGDRRVERSVSPAFRRPDRVPNLGGKTFFTNRGQQRRHAPDLYRGDRRTVRGDDRSHERPGHGGEFRWGGGNKVRCSGARC